MVNMGNKKKWTTLATGSYRELLVRKIKSKMHCLLASAGLAQLKN